ncbi:nose resistant to fluoxetine protein 6-like [Ornithodoros turicata]
MRILFLVFVICAVPLGGTRANVEEDEPRRDLEEDLKDINQLLIRKFLPLVSELTGSSELSPACSNSLLKVFLGLRQKDVSSLKMVLSNGLIPSNMFENNFVNFGGYEQCLNTRFFTSEGAVSFKGKYCTLFTDPPRDDFVKLIRKFQEIGEMTGRRNIENATSYAAAQRLSIRTGFCIPSTCSAEEGNFLVSSIVRPYGVNTSVELCRTNDPKPVEPHQVAAIVILSALVSVVLIASLVEWLLPLRNAANEKNATYGLPVEILLWFSALRNTRRLLRTKCRLENEPLRFISGIKFLMASWVVLGHAYIVTKVEIFHTLNELARMTEGVMFQFIVNAFLSVSTFLYMSGFVMAFAAAPHRAQIIKRNVIFVYISRVFQRYLRLMPAVFAIILVAMLVPLLMDGPTDSEMFAGQLSHCKENWWMHVSLASNFYPLYDVCMQHLWYVDVDVQILVVIGLPLLLLTAWFPKIGLLLSVFVGLGFSVYTTIQTYTWHYFYSFTSGSTDGRRIVDTMSAVYYRPFSHVATYVLGLIVGHMAAKHKGVSLHPVLRGFLWIASFTLNFAVIFVTLPWNRGNLPNDTVNALYGGFHRLLWSLGLSWPMFACATGCGGIVNKFLSWKLFIPIGRLTYSLYLTHYFLYVVRLGRLRTQENADVYFQVTTAVGVLGMGLFFAYLLYLCCEAPAMFLEKLIFERRKNDEKPRLDEKPKTADDNFNHIEKSRL